MEPSGGRDVAPHLDRCSLEKGGARQVNMTKPCLSFPRLFVFLFMVSQRVWTLSWGLGLLISGGYRFSYQASEDLGLRTSTAAWCQLKHR